MPQSKDKYAVIKKAADGKITLETLDGKNVTKDVKETSLNRALKAGEDYMFMHPRTGMWTREIHLTSTMWKDIEEYIGTGIPVVAKKPTTKEVVA